MLKDIILQVEHLVLIPKSQFISKVKSIIHKIVGVNNDTV